MTTALDIITSAMRKAGIITKNESPSADEANDGLEMLNDMIESWSNDNLIIYERALENFTLTSGKGEYTIGNGGDFNTTRPIYIVSAYTRVGDTDYNMKIVNDETYQLIPQKSITNSFPDMLNYTNSYPLGTIKLYPVPSDSNNIYILSEKAITSFGSLSTTVDLPAGWKRALIYNLAVELTPEYGQSIDGYVVKIANEALGKIKRNVSKIRTTDGIQGNSVRNILTGWNI